MITNSLNLDKQAKRARQELLLPIQRLAGALRRELRGCYKSIKIGGWTNLCHMQHITFHDRLPGICQITSKYDKRKLRFIIKFNWQKWDVIPFENKKDTIEFETDEKAGEIPIKTLDNEVFIAQLRDWLKTGEEMPWEKYGNS